MWIPTPHWGKHCPKGILRNGINHAGNIVRCANKDTNVFYWLTAHGLATDHPKQHVWVSSRVVNYDAHIPNFHSCPATTQPWEEWCAEPQQLTERMRLLKPSMLTAQVLHRLSTPLLYIMVHYMAPSKSDSTESSHGVQHIRRSGCWLQKRRNELLGFVRL
jgi:hypothetical protein